MYYNVDYKIIIGAYQLAMTESCEVHKSVELLADTCTIKLPDAVHGKVRRADEKIKRGDKVAVWMGYDGDLVKEFEGYLLQINTNDNTTELVCEDELFLLRKPVKDMAFKKVKVSEIVNYIIQETGAAVIADITMNLDYDKFVISKATGYDVLKKLQDETKANIYIKEGKLCIHAPYADKTGKVRYSYQENIETADLKYVKAADKKIEVIVNGVGKDGKKIEVRYGTSGGERVDVPTSGLSKAGMEDMAKAQHERLLFDGYEGDISTWLIPYVEPTYSAEIVDEDYPEKTGWYYVVSVTTSINNQGGIRKVQLGKKLAT